MFSFSYWSTRISTSSCSLKNCGRSVLIVVVYVHFYLCATDEKCEKYLFFSFLDNHSYNVLQTWQVKCWGPTLAQRWHLIVRTGGQMYYSNGWTFMDINAFPTLHTKTPGHVYNLILFGSSFLWKNYFCHSCRDFWASTHILSISASISL